MIYKGFQVFIDDRACCTNELVQIKFPKSKKKRIRDKWKKRKDNFKLKQVERVFKVEDKLIVSSKAYEILNNL